jgi:hypothetical protein
MNFEFGNSLLKEYGDLFSRFNQFLQNPRDGLGRQHQRKKLDIG